MTFERYMGEDENAFITRVCDAKDSIGTWEDVCDILNDALGYDYSSSKYRKAYQYFNKMLDANQEKYTDYQSQVEEIERLKDELYKERCKLQDANREKRKALRDFSRIEVLQEYIEKLLDERNPLEFDICDYHINNGNEGVLLVSDLHIGATVDSIFNYYDEDVAIERLEQLANKTVALCKRDNVNLLHVGLLGDFITGIIHGSTIAQAQEDVIEQVMHSSDIIEGFIVRLRKEIPEIRVYCVYGNHGRTSPGKSDRAYKENFERLTESFLKRDFRNTDIKIITNGYEDFIPFRLRDGRLNVFTHGTNDSPLTVNKNFTKLLGENVNKVYMGHLHDFASGKGTVVNGSIIGSDDYAISKRLYSEPAQVLEVYNSDDVYTYQLTLK